MRDVLPDLDFFQGLGESALQLMVSAAKEVSLAADADLFREGAAADALFIIRSGSVRVTVQPPGGGIPIVVMRLAAPAVVGERGLLGGVRAASVVTDAPSVFLKLDRTTVQGLANNDPTVRSWLDAVVRGALRGAPGLLPEGDEGIRILGHRDYVGGLWEEIGRLQFDFLVAQGLRPSHCLLDIACGALRGGVHFIHYLERGNYLGLDKEKTLVELLPLMPTPVTITPPSGRTQERTASGSRSTAEGCQSERSLAIVPGTVPNARVTTITTALSGDPPKELRFFGFAYKVPVGELDPAWPRTLTALTQKAPTTDGRRWRLAPGVDIERIETLDAETGEIIVTLRAGFVPA